MRLLPTAAWGSRPKPRNITGGPLMAQRSDRTQHTITKSAARTAFCTMLLLVGTSEIQSPQATAATCTALPVTSSRSLHFRSDLGTGSATADGDPVAIWQDQSGNGLDVAQDAPDRRPILRLNNLNGHPAIRFYDTASGMHILYRDNVLG